MLSRILGNVASFGFNEFSVLSGGSSTLTLIFDLFGSLFVVPGFCYKIIMLVDKILGKHYILCIVLSFIFSLLDVSVDIFGHVIISGLAAGNILGFLL